MSDTAHTQAVSQVESIVAMVAALECDFDRLEELREEKIFCEVNNVVFEYSEELAELEAQAGDSEDGDDAIERIQQDALSVEYRSGWASAGEELTPEEFRIVLCTGGPHVEIVGDLNQHGEPASVRVLYRDYGTSGELFDFDHDAVLTYCAQIISI